MKKILLATVVAISFAMPNAFAENANNSSAYVGVDTGAAFIKDDSQASAQSLVNTNGGSAIVVQDLRSLVGRIYAGYHINKTFAVELGYLASGDYKETATGISSGVVYGRDTKISFSGLDYSLLIRPSESLNGLFVKVGGHSIGTSVDYTSVNMISSSGSSKINGTGYLVGVGYQEQLSSAIDARVAYTYYNKVSGVSESNINALTIGVLVKF